MCPITMRNLLVRYCPKRHNPNYVAVILLLNDVVISTNCNGWLLLTKFYVTFFSDRAAFIFFGGGGVQDHFLGHIPTRYNQQLTAPKPATCIYMHDFAPKTSTLKLPNKWVGDNCHIISFARGGAFCYGWLPITCHLVDNHACNYQLAVWWVAFTTSFGWLATISHKGWSLMHFDQYVE